MNFRGDRMTKIRLLVLLIGVLAAGVTPLHAGLIFQFDEVGDLSYSLSGGPYVSMPNGVVELDPTGGIAGNVLVYDLTSPITGLVFFNGDVPIGGAAGLAGDLRFTDSAGPLTSSETCGGDTQCLMIYYVFDNNGLAADVGSVSTSFLTSQTPGTSLDPGAFTYTAGVLTYDGTIVPEPTPAIMMLLGLSGFVIVRRTLKRDIKVKIR
jgi:hypothetical protein